MFTNTRRFQQGEFHLFRPIVGTINPFCSSSSLSFKVFDPSSDEPEAEQKRPLILVIDLAMVDQDNLVKTLRGRSKTPIVIAIGRDNEITPDCAEIFQ